MIILLSEVIFPKHLEETNQNVDAPLKCFNSGELRDLTLGVEVLDPVSKVFKLAC